MRKKLKVLIVEDNPNDAELVLLELRRVGFEPDWRRVDTAAEYLKCLNGDLDLILSDYEMPQFNGLHALELLRESGLAIPFIIISGTIGEDTAVAAMKQGAADYLLKDRLARLEQAITHALDQSRLRLEREEAVKSVRESEQRLRSIFDGISAFVGLFSLDGRVIELNQVALHTAAIGRVDVVGRLFSEGPWWSHSKEMQERVAAAITSATPGLFYENDSGHRILRDSKSTAVERRNGQFATSRSMKIMRSLDGQIRFAQGRHGFGFDVNNARYALK